MSKDYGKDNVWECSGCGIIVKQSSKPNECSCRDINPNRFFLNTQVIKMNQRVKEKVIGDLEREVFNNKNWSNRNNQWMIAVGTWEIFKREVLT